MLVVFVLPWPSVITNISPNRLPDYSSGDVLRYWLVALPVSLMIALVVKIGTRRRQQPRDGTFPLVWLIGLPVVVFVFFLQGQIIIGPDSTPFGEVLIFWLYVGLASLIMALVVRIGAREQHAPATLVEAG